MRGEFTVATRKKQLSFEEKMSQLENIVINLEKGTTPLNESMELFEQGMKLSAELQKMLETAEQRVILLTEQADGTITEQELKQEDTLNDT